MNELLRVENLTKSFGGLHVNRAVSFALAAGDRVAMIGPNGAGKTTLVNLVAGALRPAAGRIALAGEDVTALDMAARTRRGLVRTFQITRLFAGLTVAENVAVAVVQRRHLAWRLLAAGAQRPDVREECLDLLDRLAIGHLADRPATAIAYGQQRLVEIAIAIALRPKVLLLDEPAAGVPRDQSGLLLDAVDRLPADIAVLMIEHDMDVVYRFAQRILVLAGGRLVFEGTPTAAAASHEVRCAYLGSYADARRSA